MDIDRRAGTSTEEQEHQQKSTEHRQKSGNIDRRARTSTEHSNN
ncbi:hypothetical protein [Virgibacillus litoralis]|uniref:Biofilm-forming protein n=1 Tax=Virgibacillus litoralis TaxID=578221 RepID=A0ABS4H8Y2_9BACI|nr:hypothetical protein [Virgibacillus litoralis]MBP1947366.1 hypothetical protein [Virgibacillus litoralis]